MRPIVLLAALAVLASSSPGGELPFSPSVSLQLTTPQKGSLSLGIAGVDYGSIWGPQAGFLVRLEPGLGGGKAHVGARFVFHMAFVQLIYADIAAAALRTWGDPWMGLPDGQTYLGAETRVGAGLLLGTLGVFHHVAGSDDGHDWILSAGVGLGI